MAVKIQRVRMAVSDLEQSMRQFEKLLSASFNRTGQNTCDRYGLIGAIEWDIGLELVQPVAGARSPLGRMAIEQLEKHGEGIFSVCYAVEDAGQILARAEELGLIQLTDVERFSLADIETEMSGRFSKYEEYSLAVGPYALTLIERKENPARSPRLRPNARIYRALVVARDLDASIRLYETLFDIVFDKTGSVIAETGTVAAVAWGHGVELAQAIPGSGLPAAQSMVNILGSRGEAVMSVVYLVDDEKPILAKAREMGIQHLMQPLTFTQNEIDSDLGGHFTEFREWLLALGGLVLGINVVQHKILRKEKIEPTR
jgi:hypothetical protein